MKMRILKLHFYVILLLNLCGSGLVRSAWWSWTESSNLRKSHAPPLDDHPLFSAQIVLALKAAEHANDFNEALKLVVQARDELMANSCWHHAYAGLFATCRQIMNDEEKKARLALKLTDCFLRVSGRPSLAPCADSVAVTKCTQVMNEHANSIYLAFFIDVASACHRLQTEAFILETKLVASALKGDADTLVGTLLNIEQQSNQIFDHTETMIEVQKKMKSDHAVLQEGMTGIQNDVEAGFNLLKLYVALTHEQLQNAISIQEKFSNQQEDMNRQQKRFSRTLEVEFSNLKSKAGQVIDSLKLNLIGQGELLSGQAATMAVLDILVKLHMAAVEEIRSIIQLIAKEDLKSRQELQTWQRELEAVSVQIRTLTASMRSNQDTLLCKASHMFSQIQNLFSLNLSILYQSQTFRTFLFYGTVLLLIFLVTSAKETRDKKELLVCASCVTLAVEVLLLYNVKLNVFIAQTVTFWLRGLLLVPSWVLLIHTYLTYKDEDAAGFIRFQAIQKKLIDEVEGCLDEHAKKGVPAYFNTISKHIHLQNKSYSRKLICNALSFQRRRRRMASK